MLVANRIFGEDDAPMDRETLREKVERLEADLLEMREAHVNLAGQFTNVANAFARVAETFEETIRQARA